MPRIGAPSGGVVGAAYDDAPLLTRIAALEAAGGATAVQVAGAETLALAAGAVGPLASLGAVVPASAVGVTGETLSGVICAAFGAPPTSGDHVAFAAGKTPSTPAMSPAETDQLQLRVFYDATVLLTYWEIAL